MKVGGQIKYVICSILLFTFSIYFQSVSLSTHVVVICVSAKWSKSCPEPICLFKRGGWL